MTAPIMRGLSGPARVQRQRQAGWRMPPGAVYVGRPTRWGNPWRVEDLGAAEAVARYRADLFADPSRVVVVRRELGGRDLACWCRLDAVCHADVLLAVANPPLEPAPAGVSAVGPRGRR